MAEVLSRGWDYRPGRLGASVRAVSGHEFVVGVHQRWDTGQA